MPPQTASIAGAPKKLTISVASLNSACVLIGTRQLLVSIRPLSASWLPVAPSTPGMIFTIRFAGIVMLNFLLSLDGLDLDRHRGHELHRQNDLLVHLEMRVDDPARLPCLLRILERGHPRLVRMKRG